MAAVDASVTEAKKEEWQRLPDSVKPIHYDVRLVPDMRHPDEGGTCKFEGEVAIELDVKQPDVKTISFNALDMTLLSATVEQNGVKQVATTALKEADEIGECTVPTALAVGKAVLTIKYTGELNDKMKGFYRSVYQDEAGKNKMLATTQFEATDARRALPCWDEPAVKATFGVTLVVPDSKDMVAVSNMPEVSSSVADGKRTVTFDKTPVMSSYLLAFVIGDFEYLEGKDANDIIIRCYTLKGKKAQGQFALDVALKTLPHYTKYFEIGYPLPKLDMFAIPDFSAGAMENWGLVTYRETALLVDEHKTSAASKEWVALVVAHELAHQWFGNLVTMEWWSHLWLNEGFATFVEFLSVDFIFPSWNIWELFVSDSLGRSLELDGLESSHPVEVEVRHPSEIDEIFDIISYSKGSCLNRMLSTFLGDEQFRQGLVKYLNKYKYANAETGDLWDVLEEHTGKPVRKVMSAWTSQTGYPVLIVTASGDAEVKLDIKQRRFLESGIPEDGKDNSLWPVPVLAAVAVADQKELKAVESLASEAQSAMSLGVAADKIDWIKINYGQSGHYRVQYDAAMLDKIIKALESGDERLSVVDRLGIQNDAFALTSAKLFDVQQLFRLIRSFRKEKNYTVWKDLTQNLSKLGGLLRATDMWPAFCRFMLELFSEVAKVVGWDKKPNEDHHTSMLRSVVINALRTYDDEEAHAEALKRFESLQAAEAEQRLTGVSDDAALAEVLIPDLRSAVYCMVVSKGGKLGYDKIYDIFRTATHPEEKVRALRALAAAPSDDLIRRTWDLALSDEVRLQNRFIPLQSLLLNRNGIHVCMELLTRDWDKLLATLGESFQLGRVIKALNSFPSAERVKQVEEFFKERQAPRAKRAIEQTLEGLKAEAAWLAHDEKGIRAFLDAHYGAPEHTEL